MAGELPAGEGGVEGRAGALRGVRVLELTAGMAGPWVGRLMAFCGAEVIKVESRRHPEVTRLYVPPRAPEKGLQPELSPWLTDWNAGKLFVALDLEQPRAVEIAKRVVARCDVVVENYRTGVMEELGLGWDALRAVKPDLVMLSTSGFGDTGPCRSYVTWGPNIEALSGLSRLSGFPGRACTITQYAYPDAVSALHGLFAVLCALAYRARTGRGQRIVLSQLEATVAVLGDVLMETLANGREPAQLGNRSLRAAPQGCYRCRGEDRWCAIAVEDDAGWERLCAALGRPEWLRDPRLSSLPARRANADELDRLIEEWTSRRGAEEAMALLQAAGVPAGVVQTVEDQYRRDPHIAARRFFEEIEHRRLGKVVANGIALGLTGTPGRTGPTGSPVGHDNAYVLREVAGLGDEEIRTAVALGAVEEAAS